MDKEKIFNVGGDELGKYDLKNLEVLNFKYFVYSYEYYSYEGSGFAVWKNENGTFGYIQLGHCSCYGPLENLPTAKNMELSLEQVEEIAMKYYDEHGTKVINKVKKLEN